MDFDRDFGVNQVFVEDQYEKWRQNPAAVSPEWAQYFARLHGFPSAPPFQASAWSQPAAPAAVIEPPTNGDGHFAGALLDFAAPEQERLRAEELQERVAELINAYRIRGHLFANLDPLGLLQPPATSELDLQRFGLSDADLERRFATGDLSAAGNELTLREIVQQLRGTYCRTIGVEFMHGEDPEIKKWLQEKMEATGNRARLSREDKLRILARLTDAETLETFLHRKYIGKKRFSLEGAESLIPLLDWLIEEFARLGGEEVVMGMAHRGRLNVLVNVFGKGLNELFAEFEDTEVETMLGRGDVKYHMGYSSDRKGMHLSLAFNPSHLLQPDLVDLFGIHIGRAQHVNVVVIERIAVRHCPNAGLGASMGCVVSRDEIREFGVCGTDLLVHGVHNRVVQPFTVFACNAVRKFCRRAPKRVRFAFRIGKLLALVDSFFQQIARRHQLVFFTLLQNADPVAGLPDVQWWHQAVARLAVD